MITYHFIRSVSDRDVEQLSTLLLQLTTLKNPLTQEVVEATMNRAVLLVARDEEADSKIVGTASLFLLPTLLGLDGLIENVVVDSGYRHQGVGKRLMDMLFERTASCGAHNAEWTSGDYRKEALSFYRGLPGVTHRSQSRYTLCLRSNTAA